MNEQNLIPFTKGQKEAREYGRLGGLTKTPERKLAAKLRELKKKGMNEESAKYLYEMMTDPEMTDLEILRRLATIQKDSKTVSERREIMKLMIEWRKFHHGEKLTIDQTMRSLNVNMAFTLTPDEISRLTKPKANPDGPVA